MLNRLKQFLLDYSILVMLTIVLNIFIRIGEFWYVTVVKFEETSFDLFFSKSINFDTLFIVLFSLVIILPLALFSLINLKIAKWSSRLVFLILILFLFVLTQYFLINNALLSSSIFEFSLKEIVAIAITEFSVNRIGFVLFLVLLIIISIFLFSIINKISSFKVTKLLTGLYLMLVFISLVNRAHTFKSLPYFKSYNQFLLGNSKPVFLLKSYYANLAFDGFNTQQEIKEAMIAFHKYTPTKNYVSLDFPLINDTKIDNVLGDVFKTADIKPNIVIIVSESLSASFSGNNLSIKNSLTPFTDSLSSKGLSWSNFLSNAERSYGVLPNLLASLPTGTGARGFINMEKEATKELRFPKHNSLVKILKANNYETFYFYGGAGNFDNVASFVNQNEIDHCLTIEKFDTSRYHIDLYARSQQAWGYKDGDLYNQGLDVMDSINSPYLSVFQTLSNHSPYNLSESSYYSNEFLQNKLTSLGMDHEDVKKIDNNILSSIFYADDALKSFFYRIREREDFENTIFIITGDHAVDLNLATNVFENYHIPFVIYSPLLTNSLQSKAVNSHLDVLPSLLALLKNNYNIVIPKSNHWLGEGLELSLDFKSNHFIPLNTKANDMPSVIINDLVLFTGDVYQFNKELEITKVKDSSIIVEFMTQFENYRKLNEYVCKNNLIDQ